MRLSLRSLLPLALTATAITLTGCSLGSMQQSGSLSTQSGSIQLTGSAHGGQQPIYNAVVRLYSVGSGGYGTGSTLLATSANSDSAGGFSFTKLTTTGGVISSGATPSWQCPASGDPLIYITAVGGNTQGTGTTSTNNAASVMMAAIGACSTVSANTFVSLNEVSTVGSVFALGQYINPGSNTTPGSFTVGAPSGTQAQLGLKNAAASIGNLVNIAGGQAITSQTFGSTGGVGTGTVSVTATPESAKINTIANILAACINTTSASSVQCVDLFNNALPAQQASYTSQPSATFTTAIDTLQAAYYMATNPASLGTFVSCGTNPSATTTMGCLYSLSSSTPPFQPVVSAQPSDWTLGVTYTASGSCSAGGAFFAGPTKTSIDASGNIWIINAVSAVSASGIYANLVELSPTGSPLLCLGSSTNGRGLTIDPTGNVWASFNTTNGIYELPAGGSALVNWSTTASNGTAYAPYTITSDGVGNIYFTNIGTGGQLLQFAAPMTNTTPYAATLQTAGTSGFNSTTSTTTNYSAIDPQNRVWVQQSTTTATYQSTYTASSNTATVSSYAVSYTGGQYATVTFQAPNTFTAGQRVVLSGLSTSGATSAGLNSALLVLPGVTSTSFQALIPYTASIASTTDTGVATAQTYGFFKYTPPTTAYGLALDSNNYAYTGTTCCGTSTTSYKELVKITPTGSTSTSVSASTQYLGGMNGIRSVALDGAANVWVGNEFSSTGTQTSLVNFPISEIATAGSGTTATFTALSPTGTTLAASACTTSVGCPTGGGFIKNDFQEVRDIGIDPSGNVWVLNTGTEVSAYAGTTVTEIVGAAVPTVTPLSVAAATGKLASKPQ
ncbi:hypothetical protein ACFQBQ_06375 [Granulicella cerasi]|uniref:Uncharacterized protein n=1 Tax=Granulicella cerasi TaxID=741063 RepID=A0ABW1Z6L1_9BACT|nr:hypothetical protein [Granulicella cerasi]